MINNFTTQHLRAHTFRHIETHSYSFHWILHWLQWFFATSFWGEHHRVASPLGHGAQWPAPEYDSTNLSFHQWSKQKKLWGLKFWSRIKTTRAYCNKINRFKFPTSSQVWIHRIFPLQTNHFGDPPLEISISIPMFPPCPLQLSSSDMWLTTLDQLDLLRVPGFIYHGIGSLEFLTVAFS